MTREQILKLWPNSSESTIQRNLDPAVCPVATGQRQQTALRSLEQGIQKRQKGKGCVEVVVSLIACRRRELDDDGNVAACKPLRDAIAETLLLDDGDKRIRFEYSQIETRGPLGVIVKITRIDQNG